VHIVKCYWFNFFCCFFKNCVILKVPNLKLRESGRVCVLTVLSDLLYGVPGHPALSFYKFGARSLCGWVTPALQWAEREKFVLLCVTRSVFVNTNWYFNENLMQHRKDCQNKIMKIYNHQDW
jgi:hypothetical protein